MNDWIEIQHIHGILESFLDIGRALEGGGGSGEVYDIYPAMDTLLENLEQRRAMHAEG
jgi:hypothetical protein